LGKTGPWRGDQVIDIILSQPQCAKFISTKIWRFFAYDDPTPPLVDALSEQLLRCKYELRPFMKIVLSSQEFFGSTGPQLHHQISSPILSAGSKDTRAAAAERAIVSFYLSTTRSDFVLSAQC
jgi:uncharacterized protein (DUF1800 family)